MKKNEEETFSDYEKRVTPERDRNGARKQKERVVHNETWLQRMS